MPPATPTFDPIGHIRISSIPIFNTPAITGGPGGTTIMPGLVGFLNTILRVILIVAGLFAFFNIIIAGFNFMNASGDPKMITKAWDKIWQTFLGVAIVAASFLFAAIIGIIMFGDPTAIINPKI